MTWTKLSDDFSDDCETLSDRAFRLHVEGLTWNNRKLLDCRLPKDHLRRFARHPDAVQELLDTGWRSEDDDVYVIRHHAVYQRTREEVLRQQDANRNNGKKGGRPPKPREQALSSETQSVSESLSESVSERVTEPVPAGAARPPSDAPSTLTKTHSLSELKSERDRPGQDRALRGDGPTTRWSRHVVVADRPSLLGLREPAGPDLAGLLAPDLWDRRVTRQSKPVGQRRAEARLAVLARLLRTGGQRAVEAYLVAERRDRLARRYGGLGVEADPRELRPGAAREPTLLDLIGEETS